MLSNMDTPDVVGTPGQDTPDDRPPVSPDTGPIVVDLAGAADILNISEDGVRKRIARGRLDASKASGRWQVVIPPELSGGRPPGQSTGQDEPSAGGFRRTDRTDTRTDNRTDIVTPSPTEQLAVFRDTFVMPLVEQIRSLEHQLADTENARDAVAAERDHERTERERMQVETDRLRTEVERLAIARVERDALRVEVERMKAAESPPVTQQEARQQAEPAKVAPSTSRSFWGRLKGLFGG